MTSQEYPAFGRLMLRNYFLSDANYRHFNHGGYGAFPATVRVAQRKFQDEQESRPDVFFQLSHGRHIDVSRKAIASLVHAPVDECGFVTNTSTGVDTILRNLRFKSGDVVVFFATVYYAVENCLKSMMETSPVQARKVEYPFPISHDQLYRLFLEVVGKARNDGLNVRAPIFDTIVSVPGVRFPFQRRLNQACKREGILDFFLSNCHKWLFTPHACALLYVPKHNHHLIRITLPSGVGYSGGLTKFDKLFDFIATADDTAFMCIPAALQFRSETCGGEHIIYAYLQKIAFEGGERVAEILGTEVMQEPNLGNSADSKLRRCAFVNIRLPSAFKDDASSPYVPNPSTSPYSLMCVGDALKVDFWLKNKLMTEFDTYAKFYAHVGWMWVRLSGQIYLELEDFEWLAYVLVDLCSRVGKGEWLLT